MEHSGRPRSEDFCQGIETEVSVIGSGIVGILTACELVRQGREGTMIAARDIFPGTQIVL